MFHGLLLYFETLLLSYTHLTENEIFSVTDNSNPNPNHCQQHGTIRIIFGLSFSVCGDASTVANNSTRVPKYDSQRRRQQNNQPLNNTVPSNINIASLSFFVVNGNDQNLMIMQSAPPLLSSFFNDDDEKEKQQRRTHHLLLPKHLLSLVVIIRIDIR